MSQYFHDIFIPVIFHIFIPVLLMPWEFLRRVHLREIAEWFYDEIL
jgi:hypothetical protein